MSLAQKQNSYADSKGHFHDTEDKAEMASAQYILDAANPKGALSVAALITLFGQNKDFWKLVSNKVEAIAGDHEVDNTVSESGTQGGTANGGPQPDKPNPSKKHTH